MIIKEFVEKDNTAKKYRVVIRDNCYGSKLSKFLKFINEARKDFDINEDEVDVVHFGGERYARTFGIEFDTNTKPPDEYVKIEGLELTR
jgi:hypothetical protein